MKDLSFTNRAKRDLKKLDGKTKTSVIEKLTKFQQDQVQALPLTGGWKGWYKIRTGDIRILLTKSQSESWIVGYIRHRKEVYKN